MTENLIYRQAETPADFQLGKELFRGYAQSLSVDLSFQNFEGELRDIDRQYNKPVGALILAYCNDEAVGCIGVRKLEDGMAELKRMYVKPKYRGYQIGATLLTKAMETAKDLGYTKMRLDTLSDMIKAQGIYMSFGFYEIPSYRYNPMAGTIYMEKEL